MYNNNAILYPKCKHAKTGELNIHIFPKTNHKEYNELVKSLPLFAGFSHEELQDILQHGDIREFPKGRLLFQEGEPANRLYILIKGWVKVFKGTSSGNEAIIQMLGTGDFIIEPSVFLNTTFSMSAQIAENATLLSFPAPLFREHLKKNNKLAINLLDNISLGSRGLIRQIANTRLKSADERIGSFLLKLMVQQNHISRCIKLPYDKSLIASYLDMKRETLSRALQRLKTDGFVVENDTIIVQEITDLCQHCDSNISTSCALEKTQKCPQHQEQSKERYA